MVDNFALVLTHALLALALWRLVNNNDLDRDPPVAQPPEPEPEREAAPRKSMPRD